MDVTKQLIVPPPHDRRKVLEEAIAHWDALALAEDEMGNWEKAQGHHDGTYRHRAESYRRTARALRMEVQTGRPHCSCCLSPDNWHR